MKYIKKFITHPVGATLTALAIWSVVGQSVEGVAGQIRAKLPF